EPPAAPRRHLRREIAEGLSIVARDPLLRMNAAFGCLSNLVLTGYQAVLVFYLVKVIGLSPGMTGVMLSLTSLGGVLGALAARGIAARIGTARAGLLSPLAGRGPGLALFLLGSIAVIGALPAGAILAGLAASHLGVRPALWIMLTGLVLSSLVLLPGPLRTLRDLPSTRHRTPLPSRARPQTV